jgi:hypothetical protein
MNCLSRLKWKVPITHAAFRRCAAELSRCINNSNDRDSTVIQAIRRPMSLKTYEAST